ncbi:MAG: rubrerythrin [Syntrophus sp. (in: bacteria)]|nr:rubrerythrin [Syntrophus sp. (in: bacteria)]
MDVYDYAMEMEKDGESYYRSAVAQATHAGIRAILTMLADAEAAHYHIFENMKKGEKARLGDSKTIAGVKNIFLKMAESDDYSLVRLSDIDLYRKAQDIEQKTMDFYREKADKVVDPYGRTLFLKLADEEKRHYLILENIIEYVSRPEQWLENPEWYHIEEY